MFRIRNELGGFWGGGVSFNVRQLTLKGVAGNKVKYEVGDIDLKMTPYTLFNNLEEGVIKECLTILGALPKQVDKVSDSNNQL